MLLRENLNLFRCSGTIGEWTNILRENPNSSKSKPNNDSHDYRLYFDTILEVTRTQFFLFCFFFHFLLLNIFLNLKYLSHNPIKWQKCILKHKISQTHQKSQSHVNHKRQNIHLYIIKYRCQIWSSSYIPSMGVPLIAIYGVKFLWVSGGLMLVLCRTTQLKITRVNW